MKILKFLNTRSAIVFAALLQGWPLLGGTVYLNKAFYHKGELSDKVAFYFSGQPHYNRMPAAVYDQRKSKAPIWDELQLFFPLAAFADAHAKKTIDALNHGKSLSDIVALKKGRGSSVAQPGRALGYEIRCKETLTPTKGIMLTIRYNPKIIAIEYAPFKAIGNVDAFFIALYQKQKLTTLHDKSNVIHQYAYAEKKKPVWCSTVAMATKIVEKLGALILKRKTSIYRWA